jgi:hypothetical protein
LASATSPVTISSSRLPASAAATALVVSEERAGELGRALAHELRRRGGRYGLATMCVGVGQGMAAVIENPAA